MIAKAQTDEARKGKDEHKLLFAAFCRLLHRWDDSADTLEDIEDLITLRASALIERALLGFSIELDRALEIIRAKNDFTTAREREQRDILVAAIENLVDFAAAGQYAMIGELPDQAGPQDFDECEAVFDKYNGHRATQENNDVMYAAAIAAWWINIAGETMLTFMTQGDERVRPWHSALEGESYPKSQFPPELIPPIEWGCRCYLVADGFGSVVGRLRDEQTPVTVNPVFRESLATGGRIFSGEHPYFSAPLPVEVKQITQKIKQKFYDNAG